MATDEQHWELFSSAGSLGPDSAQVMRRLLAAGCEPDRKYGNGQCALSVVVSAGNLEKTTILVSALECYKYSDPERYVRAMVSGRHAINQINRGMQKLAGFLGGQNQWNSVKTCGKHVESTLQNYLDTLPAEQCRVFRSVFPPINIDASYN